MARATLSIDIVAKLASLESDLGKAVRLNEKAAADIARRWESAGKAISGAFGGLAAGVSAGALTAYFKTITDGVDALNDVADATGATVETISQLEDVALRTGSSLGTVETALVKMNQVLAGASAGSDADKILKSIGLSAQELRNVDPAEALQRIAVALNQYENDGNKARITQELFGKSLKEVAPLLKDLAENGLRAASVTNAQAEAAERFNRQLFEMQKAATDGARSIVSDLIPALTSALKEFNALRNGPGVFSGLVEYAKGSFKNLEQAGEGVKLYGGKIAEVDAQIAAIKADKRPLFQAFGEKQVAELEASKVKLKQWYDYYNKLQGETAGGGRGIVNPENVNSRGNSAPDVTSLLAKPAKAKNQPSASKEHRAQLDADLSSIKDNVDAILKIYSGSESVLEAIRSAGMLDEKEYYDAKKSFIALDAQAKDKALSDEIDRLSIEHAIGVDRIKIQKQLSDVQAKRVENRVDAAVKLETLTIQEVSSAKRLAASYDEARASAQAYLSTVEKQQARTLAGFGQGAKAREKSAGLDQIDDKYSAQRSELANARARLELEGKFTSDSRKEYSERMAIIDEFHDKAKSSYLAYFDGLAGKSADVNLGMKEGVIDYLDTVADEFSQNKKLITNVFNGIEDAFVSFVQTGKLSMSSLANSIISDVARIAAQKMIVAPLASMFLGLFGDSGGGGESSAVGGTGLKWSGNRASGGPVSGGSFYEVNENGPELLTVGQRTLLMMGKDGGNVTPLRTSSGVQAQSAGSSVTVNQSFTVGEFVSRADVVAIADQTRKAAIAGVQESRMRMGYA